MHTNKKPVLNTLEKLPVWQPGAELKCSIEQKGMNKLRTGYEGIHGDYTAWGEESEESVPAPGVQQTAGSQEAQFLGVEVSLTFQHIFESWRQSLGRASWNEACTRESPCDCPCP